jgi:uncharacterized membrane protein YcaP (DUF421 family)
MLDWSWILASGSTALMVVLSALGIYVALLACTRLVGLRSFSKMSSFDFAITVGMGTVLASTLLNEQPTLVQGVVGLVALYGVQYVVSRLRVRTALMSTLVDNEALLLMAGPHVLEENLRRARVTKDDLRAKLREANVIALEQVRAVVFESTGDISVLHAPPDGPDLEPGLLADVRDADRAVRLDNVAERRDGAIL